MFIAYLMAALNTGRERGREREKHEDVHENSVITDQLNLKSMITAKQSCGSESQIYFQHLLVSESLGDLETINLPVSVPLQGSR